MKTDRKNIIGKILVVDHGGLYGECKIMSLKEALEHIRMAVNAEDKDNIPVKNDIELAEYLLHSQKKSNGLTVCNMEYAVLTDTNIDQWIEYYWKSAYMRIKYDGNSLDDISITEPWFIFPSGTKIRDIFEWAESTHSKGIDYLQNLSNWLF